ncbi:hypothetical protein GCWB2_03550 [Gordonia rubripertincta]|nr:hypothetical protein GCWB2_03550 [Gordonia rubripertincta]
MDGGSRRMTQRDRLRIGIADGRDRDCFEPVQPLGTLMPVELRRRRYEHARDETYELAAADSGREFVVGDRRVERGGSSEETVLIEWKGHHPTLTRRNAVRLPPISSPSRVSPSVPRDAFPPAYRLAPA